jgi:hypothetical protein
MREDSRFGAAAMSQQAVERRLQQRIGNGVQYSNRNLHGSN